MIQVNKVNEVYVSITTDPGISREISDYFSFLAPGHLFHKAFKNDLWDGRIRVYKKTPFGGYLYVGLVPVLKKLAESRDYDIEIDSDLRIDHNEFDISELNRFIITSEKGDIIKPYDYQISSVKYAIEKERCLIKSATGSGKSLQIYLILRYYQDLFDQTDDKRKLTVIVPNVALVTQMYNDFKSYSQLEEWDVKDHCHKVSKGIKTSDKRIIITTWQSIYKEEKDYFDNYGLVIVDECHLATAKSLTSIMEKLDHCRYRIGLTGSLKNSKSNKISLVGLFGRLTEAITTRELIDSGRATDLKIKVVVIKYSKDYAKTFNEHVREAVYDEDGKRKWSYKYAYPREIKVLTESNRRNKFIVNLVGKMTSNTLLLFKTHVHGEELLKLLKRHLPDRKVYFVTGLVKPEEREEIRKNAELEDNCIILATFKTFSTGINIKNLHNIIYGVPIASEYTNIQSIGRAIRLLLGKSIATLYDIADDITHGKRKNYALKHMEERLQQYSSEKHDFKLINIKIT